jgi:hypothetical protein
MYYVLTVCIIQNMNQQGDCEVKFRIKCIKRCLKILFTVTSLEIWV